MSNFKEKCKAKLTLLTLLVKSIKINKLLCFFILVLCISVTCLGYGIYHLINHSNFLATKALEENQALFVNIVTEEIFNGTIYKPAKSEGEEVFNASPVTFRSPPQPSTQAKSKVAIVITNLGLNKASTLAALELPRTFTMGFSPYAVDLDQWLEQSYGKGFESLINLPMQPKDYPINDPGPLSMLINLSNGENLSKFDQVASKSNKCIGFYTDPTEVYSQSRSNFSPILSQIAQRQFLLVYGNQENSQGILEMCKSVNAECVVKAINLDDDLSEEKIKKQLLILEGMLQTHKEVIAFAKSFPVTVNVLKKWLTEIDQGNISIVPISQMIATQFYKESSPRALKSYQPLSEKEPTFEIEKDKDKLKGNKEKEAEHSE